MKSEVRSQKVERNCLGYFNRDGFQIFEGVIPSEKCDALASELTRLFRAQQKTARNKIGGVRNLLQSCAHVAELANSPRLTSMVTNALGQTVFPVRAIFFDKTSEGNWLVPWHQDLSIAVVERIETKGFDAWSLKDGVIHVQPPCEILESMATIRLHLDDCVENNGALKVFPGSHLHGKLSAGRAADWSKEVTPVVCEIRKGGALLMRPLLVHSSSPAIKPSHRRVLHIEYACRQLPNGLKWFR